jgi:glycosyltransferase involved in cell wall biosynthesis
VGAGKYIIEFSRALAQEAAADELVVFAARSRLPLLGLTPRPGLEVVAVPDQRVARRLIWEQLEFPSLLRRHRIDLLHSPHYTMPYTRPCRHVVAFHDFTFFLFPRLHTRMKRLLFPQLMRLSARRADALLASSESTRADALRLLAIPPAKIITVPLGVADAYYQEPDAAQQEAVRARYNLPPRFILYVGLVEPRKNLLQLVEAFHGLHTAHPDVQLVVVGRMGWMVQTLLDRLAALDLGDRVQFTGYVPEADLAALYALAEVFVYPSVYEGFGLPVLEALACGAPVITTNVSSMPEIVGDAGVLIPPGDGAALQAALGTLLEDPARRAALQAAGRARGRLFPWRRTARESLAVYRQVLEIG